MFRGYWCFIIASFIAITTFSAAYGQASTSSNVVTEKTQGTQKGQHHAPASTTSGGSLNDRKQSRNPDCGTPKECRAEQRDKDDLVAQQTAAKAATDQANLLFWQTIIATLGVLAVIATLIYTHKATAAAVSAVAVVTQAEKGMLCIASRGPIFTVKDNTMVLNLILSNVGKTAATLFETCIYQTSSDKFEDFSPKNVRKHNSYIVPAAPQGEVDTVPLYVEIGKPMLVVGYYKWRNAFEKRNYCDHFCYAVSMQNGNPCINHAEGADWPPDCV